MDTLYRLQIQIQKQYRKMRTVSRLDKECKAKGRELAHAGSAQGDSAPKRLNAKTTN